MAYTTLADVKAELGISATTDDTLLTDYIATAQRTLEARWPIGTGRVFEASSDSTRYADAPAWPGSDPDGPSFRLLIDHLGDLASITSIVNGDGVTLTADDYVTLPRTQGPYYAICLKRYGTIRWTYSTNPENAIAITGKWAYSVTPPDDIVRACVRMVVWMYRAKDNAGADQAVQTERGIILPTRMPQDIRTVIDAYAKRDRT